MRMRVRRAVEDLWCLGVARVEGLVLVELRLSHARALGDHVRDGLVDPASITGLQPVLHKSSCKGTTGA